jgi:hypothetical protein|eukprot:2138478-Prymnesium_polylepis.2
MHDAANKSTRVFSTSFFRPSLTSHHGAEPQAVPRVPPRSRFLGSADDDTLYWLAPSGAIVTPLCARRRLMPRPPFRCWLAAYLQGSLLEEGEAVFCSPAPGYGTA